MNVQGRTALALGFGVTLLALLLGVRRVAAEEYDPSGQSTASHRQHRITGIHLDIQSGWSIGLEGHAGLTTLSTMERTKGHANFGGLTRFRWRYFELGAGVEASDYSDERWRSLGGFLGAYLPFTNWIDIDASLGLAMRNYVSSDTRYGSNGASVQTPALTLRLGISDRPLEHLISPRLGAALLLGIDLKQRDVTWIYEVPGTSPITGTTSFGGLTAGLVVNLGFDLAQRGEN